jgi:hypothetical protein
VFATGPDDSQRSEQVGPKLDIEDLKPTKVPAACQEPHSAQHQRLNFLTLDRYVTLNEKPSEICPFQLEAD